MGSETTIYVRVLRAHEEWFEVSAVTKLYAEMEARRLPGVIAVLEASYERPSQSGDVEK